MKEIFRQFRIQKEERPVALFALALAVMLQAIIISRYNDIFTNPGVHYWAVFLHHFQISGFDPITYSVVTDWTAKYNVYRHPLLAFFVAPLYWLNALLFKLTGVNCVQYVVALVWIMVAVYAFLFFFRLVKEILSSSPYKEKEAFLLTAMLYSFAYVMLSAMVPDHFILSMMMLLLVLLVCQRKNADDRLTIAETLLLFTVTAGITLSNGIKVFICAFFVNRRKFFRPKYLLLAVLLPSALIWGIARTEYHYLVLPQEKIAHAKKAKEKKRKQEEAAKKKALAERMFELQIKQAESIGDTVLLANASRLLDSVKTAKPAARRNPNGKPLGKGEFMRWTDITTPRWDSAVENLLGESLQLHQDYTLGDVLRHRPVIVRYRSPLQYAVIGVVILFFLAGVWCGRRSRLLWMALACAAFDMLLHLGLGFGLNEVYIMSAHWIFVLPLAMAFLLKEAGGRRQEAGGRWGYFSVLTLCVGITLYLYIYNLILIFQNLT